MTDFVGIQQICCGWIIQILCIPFPYLTMLAFPVAQPVEHDANNPKVKDHFPSESIQSENI